jgi:hypothetical protein
MSVSFVSAFDQLAEFGSKGRIVKEVVHSKARSGSLPGVRRADTLLRGSDATRKTTHPRQPLLSHRKTQSRFLPRSSELYLLETIHDLVEIENELCPIGDEQSVGTIETV